MGHNIDLITTIAATFGLSLVMGFIAVRLKLPALVGYLIAGVLIGPATPGYVANLELSSQLAEIGIMLLMFGVGLHFSVQDLLSVRRIALPGAIAQIVLATLLGMGISALWGWNFGAGFVFGLALSVASTVVLLRTMEDRGAIDSINGRIAIGWLVVEDLAMVVVLVLLPSFAEWQNNTGGALSASSLLTTLAITLGQVAVFVALMLIVGRRIFPWLLWQVARTGSRELFTLCVIAAAVGIAYAASELFGVSFALGAFFAGMVMRESALSHRAADESLPLRDAFSVLFFASVGMLFDPHLLLQEPLKVLAVVAVIMFGKSLAAFFLVLLFRYPLNTALTVSAGLAQIGEFSFILAGFGVSLKLLPMEGQNLILAGALISIALNPLLFRAVDPLQAWIRKRSGRARRFERTDDPLAVLPMTVDDRRLTRHAVIVGYGRVGRRIGEALSERGISIVVAEQNREIVEELRAAGIPAVSGDASEAAVLIQAHIARARMLIVAIPDAVGVRKMGEVARTLNPRVEIIVRTPSAEEAALLEKDGLGKAFSEQDELALGMSRHALERLIQRTAS
ncbi:YbaL family putative K(+) efflux transporter [Acidihalobacter prosperus]